MKVNIVIFSDYKTTHKVKQELGQPTQIFHFIVSLFLSLHLLATIALSCLQCSQFTLSNFFCSLHNFSVGTISLNSHRIVSSNSFSFFCLIFELFRGISHIIVYSLPLDFSITWDYSSLHIWIDMILFLLPFFFFQMHCHRQDASFSNDLVFELKSYSSLWLVVFKFTSHNW